MANAVLYGFHHLGDIFGQPVREVGIRQINDAIDEAFRQHNLIANAIIDLFATRTTEYKLEYNTAGFEDLQPLDENGRALPTKPQEAFYDRMFPLRQVGTAWGRNNRETRARMTVEMMNRIITDKQNADLGWLRRHILASLFTDDEYTWRDTKGHGPLLIKPMANGDTETYWTTGNPAGPSTANHFRFQNGAISNSAGFNPYLDAYNTLSSYPENQGATIWALIPTGLRATTEALAGFYAPQNPRIITGANTDVLASVPAQFPFGRYVGYVDGVDVQEWPQVPAGYIIFIAIGGAEKPIVMRENDLAEFQGFNLVGEREDYPWWERQFVREAGFGTWNRTGALIYRISAASYAPPTGYAQPLEK